MSNREWHENEKPRVFNHMCSLILGKNRLESIKALWRTNIGKTFIIIVTSIGVFAAGIGIVSTLSGAFVDAPVVYKSIKTAAQTPLTENNVTTKNAVKRGEEQQEKRTTEVPVTKINNNESRGKSSGETVLINVPHLTGKKVTAALSELETAGFRYKTNDRVGTSEPDYVTKQEPLSGTELNPSRGHWEVTCTRTSYIKAITKRVTKNDGKGPEYVWEDTSDGRKEFKIERSEEDTFSRYITDKVRIPAEYEVRWVYEE